MCEAIFHFVKQDCFVVRRTPRNDALMIMSDKRCAMNDTPFANRAGSAAGVVRWRGWRLPFIDYETWQQGHDLVFVLENEGDLMLVPLALNGRVAAPQQPIAGGEVEAALMTVREWIAQGWRVIGRLHTSFVGYDAEDDFWRQTYVALGQRPRSAKANRRRRRT